MSSTPQSVLNLVERFKEQYDAYKALTYNEAQVRREFIDPLFRALGWDIDNVKGFAEQWKEVVHEDSIKIGEDTRAPDYSFRLGGRRLFFLEAKKPSVNLKDDPSPAYQLRRYAWTAKMPLSILTDFEEFIVYDTRVRPAPGDAAHTARILYKRFDQYEKEWDDIASIFSPEAIQKGAFDKYVESKTKKRGTAEVDDAFLAEIEEWRDALARNIALRNPGLSQRDLNYAVQCTIDRIIFLRIAEDRGMEEYGRLRTLTEQPETYKNLRVFYSQADDRYNSGLFHFHKERDRVGAPDELTPRLIIDDKVLKGIFKRLYYPESPYEFSVFPPEILGHVYERFLGSVIRLTTGGQAKVEQKPEVRKAGGVYYTPTYIVDYIVKHTVGKLLEGKTPQEVAGLTESWKPSTSRRPLAILDPACGSGSFLLGAYQYLLNWHLDVYSQDADTWSRGKEPRIHAHHRGGWRLTNAERRRILLTNIFGVDIDAQAVEVTKLSLLLKVLEGADAQALQDNKLVKDRLLPDLDSNIKCGNSLIGPDFYANQQISMFDEEEMYRVNAFDWKAEFPEIMQTGGFDAVIGNPPYIPIETMTEDEKTYYIRHYQQLERKYDSAAVFILACVKRLTSAGKLGFISSITWQTGENYSKLREYLFREAGVSTIVNLPFDVFKSAYVDTGVYIITSAPQDFYQIYRFPKKAKTPDMDSIPYIAVQTNLVVSPDYKIVLDPDAQSILRRWAGNDGVPDLGSLTISTQGLAAGRFTLGESQKSAVWFPFLVKGQVYRYQLIRETVDYACLASDGIGEFVRSG